MPEMFLTLDAIADREFESRKFAAGLEGISLEGDEKPDEEDPNEIWGRYLTEAQTGGVTSNPKDILSYSGRKASQAGFGIGQGIDYVGTDSEVKWWTE